MSERKKGFVLVLSRGKARFSHRRKPVNRTKRMCPPHVKRVFAKGSLYWYFRTALHHPDGTEVLIPLPDPDSEEFGQAYADALSIRDEATTKTKIPIGSRVSWIYFIGGDDGPVKIGRSSSPERRLAAIQAHSPVKLRILAITEGDAIAEQAYHNQFISSHSHGEWFHRSAAITAEINRLVGWRNGKPA